MDIKELRQKPHISASGIQSYIDCSLEFKYGRIDKLKPEFRASALEFGSCIHKSLSDFHLERMMGGKFTLQEFHQNFQDYWRDAAEGKDNIKYKKGKSFQTLLQEGKDLLTTYYNNLPDDNFKVLALEEPFSFNIPGISSIPVIGVFDMIEEDESGTIIIVEFKTSKQSYSQDKIDKSLQLTLYQMAAKANGFHGRDILLRFDVLIKTQTKKFEQYYTSRTQMHEKRLAKKISHIVSAIDKGIFIPNDTSWKCGGCSYKNACRQWFEK